MHPNKGLFSEGLHIVLRGWSALTLATTLSTSTEDLREDLHSSLLDHFSVYGANIEPEDLEDILLEVMNTEAGVILEDESERQVAKMIWELYRECIRGEKGMVEKLRAREAVRLANTGGSDLVRTQSQLIDQQEEFSEYSEDEMIDE